MRDYGKISPQFWTGKTGKAIKAGGPDAVVVAVYLMSSPHSNMIGMYYLPMMYLAHETGLGIEGASKGLRRACEAGFCSYDEASEVVWVHEMARYQIAGELSANDNRVKGIQREIDSVPENPFVSAFYDKYSSAFKLKKLAEKPSPFEAPSKPLRSQEQEQEQEQDKTLLSESDDSNDDFEQFWTAYPKKQAKKDAAKAFRSAKLKPEQLQTVLQDIKRRGSSPDWQKDGGKFIPLPATFIRGQRWLDEPVAPAATQPSHPVELPNGLKMSSYGAYL